MTEFIVLGTIPGTTIQIDFTLWLYVSALCLGTGLALYGVRHRRALYRTFVPYMLAWALARTKLAYRTA